MSIMFHHKSPVSHKTAMLFTIPEAAWIADIDQGAVKNDIKKNVVRKADSNRVMLDWYTVGYLRSVKDLHKELTVELRKRIHTAIRKALVKNSAEAVLSFGVFSLRLDSVIEDIERRSAEIRESRELVDFSPSVKGGDFVIKGTRIAARVLAEMNRNGASIEDLCSGYHLTQRQVNLAILFDQLHPKVGRPIVGASAEWSNLGDVERCDIEYLGELRRS